MPLGEKTKALWSNPEYRKRMSEAHKGKIHNGSFKRGHGIIGGWKSESGRRKKIGIANSGAKNFFFGKKLKGEKSGRWKGDAVGYIALHSWLKRQFGRPDKCENRNCVYPRKAANGRVLLRPTGFEWANLDGVYARDRKHWVMLCCHCHRIFDKSKDKSSISL